MPAEIELYQGETKKLQLRHIYSEYEIGTPLAIDVRVKEENTGAKNIAKISNFADLAEIEIDASSMEPGEKIEVILESFNTLSEV